MFMFHCAYSILALSPLSFSSARRRKFFLCRGAWKNKTLVDLFRSMRCQKERLIGTDVLSKDCIPSSQEWSESMAKGLEAIRELKQTTDDIERPVTAPNAENTALMIAEFMRPLPSLMKSGFGKTNAVVSIRRQASKETKEQGSALSRFRSREQSSRLRIQEAIQTCIAANEAFIASEKQKQQVCLKLLCIFFSLKIDI
jgi:hypothetical protein